MSKLTFHIITIFPDSMRSYLATSVLGRAQTDGHIGIQFYDPRDYTTDVHRSVDDTPYGGGAGMVMKAEPIVRAVDAARAVISKNEETKIILLSAKGEQYTQKHAVALAREYRHVILITGRYEGIDERVVAMTGAEEFSIGPYVLTDGELPAMAVVSSVARLVPGVISFGSLEEESHWGKNLQEEVVGTPEYPHYTKPEVIEYNGREYRVPEVLRSGNHKEISDWRRGQRSS